MRLLRPKLYTSFEEATRNPGRVRRLHLTAKPHWLSPCPEHLAQFVHLEELQIGWCSDSRLPDEVQALGKLKSLSCLNTPIEALPDWLFSCRQLRRLVVRGSDLRVIPEQVRSLSDLRDVDFGNNGLPAVPAALGSLPKLRTLNLSDNRLTDLPSEITDLARLQWLGLVGNAFSESKAGNIRARFRQGVVFF